MLIFSSCERDDICIDDITPHVILRFYDAELPTDLKVVNQLSVKVLGIDNDSLFFTGLDSIAIPVNVLANNTAYTLTVDSNNGTILNRDVLTLSYTLESIFVGRSCGYKGNFLNSTYQISDDGDNWIESVEIINENITNETAAHVKIFH